MDRSPFIAVESRQLPSNKIDKSPPEKLDLKSQLGHKLIFFITRHTYTKTGFSCTQSNDFANCDIDTILVEISQHTRLTIDNFQSLSTLLCVAR